MININDIRIIMSIIMFALGFISFGAGIWTILAREHQAALSRISAQVTRLNTQALTDIGAAPVIDSTSRLIESITNLIRTQVGVGAFLSLCGAVVCLASFWMLSTF